MLMRCEFGYHRKMRNLSCGPTKLKDDNEKRIVDQLLNVIQIFKTQIRRKDERKAR